jgi:hypothetical protein
VPHPIEKGNEQKVPVKSKKHLVSGTFRQGNEWQGNQSSREIFSPDWLVPGLLPAA